MLEPASVMVSFRAAVEMFRDMAGKMPAGGGVFRGQSGPRATSPDLPGGLDSGVPAPAQEPGPAGELVQPVSVSSQPRTRHALPPVQPVATVTRTARGPVLTFKASSCGFNTFNGFK
jgi:hypothetical protein